MKTTKIVYFFLSLLFVTAISCKQDEKLIPQPEGYLVSYEGCKSFTQGKDAGSQFSLFYDQNQDCIKYQYYGDSVLEIQHINAGFNCCPKEIVASIDISDNVILIEESETEPGCLCLCLFDVNYKIEGLLPGKYTIKILEPYTNDQDQKLQFTVDLSLSNSGTYCVSRNHYPWLE